VRKLLDTKSKMEGSGKNEKEERGGDKAPKDKSAAKREVSSLFIYFFT
jgi:hypothetical protein